MTAISLDVPRPAQHGRGQNSAQFSRTATLAVSAASSPARHPGSFSRQTTHAMSHLQAQYAEASASAMAPQPNGIARAVSPGNAPVRPGHPLANGRRNTSPIPSSSRRPSSAPGDNQPVASSSRVDGGHVEESSRSAVTRPAKPPLLRSKSEHHPRYEEADDDVEEEYHDLGARHGFEDHYLSEDVIAHLANNWYMYFTDKRHETTGKPKTPAFELQDWRMRDRLKTVSAAIAVCLNIGVEPPDQLRTAPGAKLEAWQDPTVPPVSKALENIGKSLQAQYETLALRTRYKQYLDPSIEETKKFCISLRRNAKDERVLFHYNGHGVPKPTASGEIWVFNKNYTQYIPVSLYDLQQWLQAPTIFVWDCSEATNILKNYHKFVDKHEEEDEEHALKDLNHEKTNYRPYIHLAACDSKENLPTNPLLPADLFTCCLTTPIEMALWFFVLQNPLDTNLSPERARKLPGRLQERRTPLGELNWIFTAITDTIAWTTLPPPSVSQVLPPGPDGREADGVPYEYVNSTFFTEQLTAFEIYLTRGDAVSQKPPEQLPVVLQVLLSQQHRLRALILLGRFLDLGPWAVQLALSIGIFPYVLKLLQSAAQELKPVMVFIWTRVLAVDISCQQDLIKDNGYTYFAAIMKPQETFPVVGVVVLDEHKAMCAFILAMLCKGFKPGQIVCNSTDIMTYCLHHIEHPENPLLRQWSCLCISQLWRDLPDAKWRGIRENAHLKLSYLIKDHCPEVRAAMAHAMTTFLGIPDITDEVARIEEGIAWAMLELATDGSPIVRKELLVFFSHFVLRYESKFLVAAYEQLLEEKEYQLFAPPEDGLDHKMGLHFARRENRERDGTITPTAFGVAHDSVFAACWKHINILSVDPHPEVQRDATNILDYVHHALLHSPVGAQAQTLMDEILRRARKVSRGDMSQRISVAGTRTAAAQPMPSPGLLKRTASYLFGPLMGTLDAAANAPTPPATPALQRTFSQRSRKGPSHENAPPEQHDQVAPPSNYHIANEPLCAGYTERKLREAPTLPLASTFLDWSTEYFREPQMKAPEAEEPGSNEYNERLWRRARNEAVLRETQPQKTHARTHKWNGQAGVILTGSQPSKMTFHQFENHIAVADDGNTVTIWDWKTNSRKSRFSNGNPEGSKISDMRFINEDDQALLMTGSSDGVIRIYHNYDSDADVELASSWRALTHMVPSNVNSGMVFDWQQVNGQVLVAGDERVIRIWNAGHEMCTHEIPARSGSCVTALASDQMTGNIFVAGFGDGAIRVFDARMKPQETMVRKWKDESRQWVRSVHMQRGGQRELLSASRNGKVHLWDIRMEQPLNMFQTTKDVLRTASTHEHLPVFAVGTSAHLVKIFDFDGHEITRVEPYSGFLGHKAAPLTSTAFHPHRMLLGCAARGDNHVSLYACSNERVGPF
ncbi:conserved hypothetical protein [Chaetomium globosum CBS 148.51]|uniref:Raptor N-terminal CASPase-like domain-containing protein n=1 Tax=Chaetomium globosum (strain ATCC 6205 / CBS 148.51 / DSM 1962 / NBRC 6347 / NRRL 1970) TaxID=306901 RepID=Q2H508_CHAGB|nr:uncharacterized protein CHGG_06257 [Chaetomium globosum CBS 148.51]EAQ89638.1 conserved hypothetical protein [Chaetomium globosum CBS 148.51]